MIVGIINSLAGDNGIEKLVKTYVHDPEKSQYRIEVNESVRKIVKNYFNKSVVLHSRIFEDGFIYVIKAKDWLKVMNRMLSEGITIYGDYCKGINIISLFFSRLAVDKSVIR